MLIFIHLSYRNKDNFSLTRVNECKTIETKLRMRIGKLNYLRLFRVVRWRKSHRQCNVNSCVVSLHFVVVVWTGMSSTAQIDRLMTETYQEIDPKTLLSNSSRGTSVYSTLITTAWTRTHQWQTVNTMPFSLFRVWTHLLMGVKIQCYLLFNFP